MTDWLILFSAIGAGSVRVIIGLFLVARILAVRKPKKRTMILAAAGVIVICLTSSISGLPDFYRIALEAVWIFVCASRFQNADGRMSLFVGIFYEIAVSFWQFLFAAFAGVLFRLPMFPDYGTKSGQVAVWLLHGLLIILALHFSRHQDITEKEAFRFASVIAVAGLLAVVTLSEQTILMIADDMLDMWTILSIALMVSILVFNMNRQYEMEKQFARLKSEQAELLERDYTTLNNAYAINAKLFHDFHNHIGVLRQLLSHRKLEEAVRYLDELQAPVREMADTMWTGDETVDYLINSKAVTAKACGIQLQIKVEFPCHTNLRSADLCAILGNFLDNALEAAKQVPEPEQRLIRLTIRRINQMLVIKVENSFTMPPVKEGDMLKTTKEENGLHGWGLKSARTAAEKYDGMVQTSYTDSIFRAVATLSYQSVSIE